MQVARERDLSSLEHTLKYTWAVETYVRFTLTTFWFLYWPILVFAAVLVVAAPALFVARRVPGGSASDDLHTYYLFATSALTGLAFWFILIKAVAHYSKKWAIVGLLLGCYLTYENLTIIRTAETIYPKEPTARLHLLLALGLRVALQVCLLVTFWHIIRMKRDDLALWLPTQNLKFFPRRALRDSTAVPPVVDFLRRGRFLAVILVVLGSSFFFVIPYDLERSLGDAVNDLIKTESECQDEADVGDCLHNGIEEAFHTFVFGVPLAIGLCLLTGSWILAKGRKRITWSLEEMSRLDLRPPILFLRPFSEDGVRLQGPRQWFLPRLLTIGQPATTLEEVLLEQGSTFGPVVGLGSEKDKLPPYGAARGYFDNKTWRRAVIDLSRDAQAIIVYLDKSEGLEWELAHLGKSGYHGRCLFLVPDKYFSGEENAELMRYVAPLLGTEIPSAEECPAVLGFFYEPDGITLIRSSDFASPAYVATLRWFLRRKFGSRLS
jgi:hypothetical protein